MARTTRSCKNKIESLTRLSNLMNESEWEKVSYWLQHSGIAGYFYKKFLSFTSSSIKIPPEVIVKLEGHYNSYIYRNILLRHLYEIISKKLAENGIQYIPIKGVYLIEEIYPDPGYRSTGDIDILIKEKDLPKVDEILLSEGFSAGDETTKYRYRWLHYHYHYTREFYSDPVSCEIHWKIQHSLIKSLNYELLWEKSSRKKRSHLVNERTLSPPYELFLLMVHTAKHRYSILIKWLMDIFLYEKKHRLKNYMDELIELISTANCPKAIYFISSLVENFFYSPDEGRHKQISNPFKLLKENLKIGSPSASILSYLARPDNFMEKKAILREKHPANFFGLLMQDGLQNHLSFTIRAILWKLHLEGLIP